MISFLSFFLVSFVGRHKIITMNKPLSSSVIASKPDVKENSINSTSVTPRVYKPKSGVTFSEAPKTTKSQFGQSISLTFPQFVVRYRVSKEKSDLKKQLADLQV